MAGSDADDEGVKVPATAKAVAKPNPDAPLAVTTVMLIVINSIGLVLAAMGVFVFGDRLDVPQYLVFVGIVAGVASLAVKWPFVVGHTVAFVIGAACVAAGAAALWKGLTPVLPVTLLVEGALLGVLATKSWQGNRAAWSFLIALLAVEFVCMFFGAPKVRGTVGIDIWLALITPGLATTAVVALAVESERYAAKPSGATAAAAAVSA